MALVLLLGLRCTAVVIWLMETALLPGPRTEVLSHSGHPGIVSSALTDGKVCRNQD